MAIVDTDKFDARVLELVNQARDAEGLNPLTLSEKLDQAADLHSAQMVEHDFVDHDNPTTGSTFDSRIIDAGFTNWTGLAENVAAGQPTPESVVAAWLSSTGHRRNILNPNFQYMGYGYQYASPDLGTTVYYHYHTQTFASGSNPGIYQPEDPTAVSPIMGSSGSDFLRGSNANDSILGQAGADTLRGEAGDDTLNGGDGADILLGAVGKDSLLGGIGNDTLHGGLENDSVEGGAGKDYLKGDDGNDSLFGGTGDDTLVGGTGKDFILGESQNDTLIGQAGADTLLGGAGHDSLNGGSGNDSLLGGSGRDVLSGSIDNDFLAGGGSDDTLFGGSGEDFLRGDAGNDILTGQGGNDTLFGGTGNDILTGGGSQDRFVFSGTFSSMGRDEIKDMTVIDHLSLSRTTFGLSIGIGSQISVDEYAQVMTTSQAASSSARIVYNTSNGQLFYNENGTALGFGGGGHFATLSNHFSLDGNHIELRA